MSKPLDGSYDNIKKKIINNLYFKFSVIIILLIISLCCFFTVKNTHLSFFDIKGLVVYLTFFIFILVIFYCIVFFDKLKKIKKSVQIWQLYDIISFVFLSFAIISFISTLFLTPVSISGSSMEDTLYNNDKVLVWHFNYEPKKDDIVIIDVSRSHYQVYEESLYVKRVIASKGDKVVYQEGKLYINDNYYMEISKEIFNVMTSIKENNELKTILKDDYISLDCSICLGDNVSNSLDSRYLGAFYNDDILGSVKMRLLPLNRITIF